MGDLSNTSISKDTSTSRDTTGFSDSDSCENLADPDLVDLPISDEWLRKNESRVEKRVRVLSEGTPVRFVVCPLCGLNRVLDKRGKGRVRWDAVDLDTALILQVRCGGGRGSGFFLDESQSLTLTEMSESPEYEAIVEEIRRQAQSILHALSTE